MRLWAPQARIKKKKKPRDDAADRRSAHRSEDAAVGDHSACHAAQRSAADGALLAMAHAVPRRAPSHGGGHRQRDTDFGERCDFHICGSYSRTREPRMKLDASARRP
jgi:hypothetical protein